MFDMGAKELVEYEVIDIAGKILGSENGMIITFDYILITKVRYFFYE